MAGITRRYTLIMSSQPPPGGEYLERMTLDEQGEGRGG